MMPDQWGQLIFIVIVVCWTIAMIFRLKRRPRERYRVGRFMKSSHDPHDYHRGIYRPPTSDSPKTTPPPKPRK